VGSEQFLNKRAAHQSASKLVRHADNRTTMNVYGSIVTDEISTASGKVAQLVANGTVSGTEPTSTH
jgi:hypothetical protein